MSLSERIRPGSEAAPWVCEEIKRMEALLAQMAAALEIAEPHVAYTKHTAQASDFTTRAAQLVAVQAALTAYTTMSPDPQWQWVPTKEEFIAAIQATPTRPGGFIDYGDIYDAVYKRAREEG